MTDDTPHDSHNAGGSENWQPIWHFWRAAIAVGIAVWIALGWLAWKIIAGSA